MDISLLESSGKVSIKPLSIHGVLWLQTHFDCNAWEPLIEEKALISLEDAKLILDDAFQAGINVNLIPALTNPQKF